MKIELLDVGILEFNNVTYLQPGTILPPDTDWTVSSSCRYLSITNLAVLVNFLCGTMNMRP
jgi:hypothetical protein